MRLLLGSTRSRALLDRMAALGWGRLFASERPHPVAGEPWALDNGVFGAWRSERAWSELPFTWALTRAERAMQVGRLHAPLFAVLPDRVADASSLAYSLAWHERIGRLYSVPWALVLQNGMKRADVVAALRTGVVSTLFLGGDDVFKLTARSWCELAHEHGARFHFARVSTVARLLEARAMGADSADTTQPMWSVKAFDRFERAWAAAA